MRVIIAGTRTITDPAIIAEAIALAGFDVTEVVSGGARGVDRLGEAWARARGIRVRVFPAEWARYGRRAGPVRNRTMAEHADALIAIWDGASRGTAVMIDAARARGLAIYVHRTGPVLP